MLFNLLSFFARKAGCRIMSLFFIILSFLFLAFSLLIPLPLHAQIATDGTMGPAMSLPGPDVVISQELGSTAGRNLFHSFRSFGIPTGESATFTGADDVANVISRVTGGEASHIDGLLRSEVGRADFFFINPSGVVLGPNAEVHVPASFHVSTAHELRFQDGSVFSAAAPGSSTLTQAPPTAFGFLGTQRSTIEINGLLFDFTPKNTITVSAGDVIIASDQIWPAVIETQGGDIHITAAGDGIVAVPLDGTASSQGSGSVVMDYALVDVSGEQGGTVSVNAGSADIRDFSVILADNWGEKPTQGGVRMKIGDRLHITGNSSIESDVRGAGGGGTVHLSVDGTLLIENGGYISSSTFSAGNAGGVVVHAGEMLVDGKGDEAGIFSHAQQGSQGHAGTVLVTVDGVMRVYDGASISGSTFAEGNAGGVAIHAAGLVIDGKGGNVFTGISSSTYADSENGLYGGRAGLVEIGVDGAMQVFRGGAVVSSTWAKGDAGNIVIHAGELIMSGQGGDRITGIASSAEPGSQGHAGEIELSVAGTMQVLDGASVSTATFDRGNAGRIVINARELVVHNMDSERFTGITSQANPDSRGHGGAVEIIVDDLMQVLDGAVISSSTFAQGDAGEVDIHAGNLIIDGKGQWAGIISHVSAGSQGHGGTVRIIVDDFMQILDGGFINADTCSTGNAGNVAIHAGKLLMDRRGSDWGTGISSDVGPSAAGHAGRIDVTVDGLILIFSGARIAGDTYSMGNAGNIRVHAGELIIDGKNTHLYTGISSDAEDFSHGHAGSLEIIARGPIRIFNGGEISTETRAQGNAGDVIVHASILDLDGSRISSAATSASTGHVGNITMEAGSVSLGNGSVVSVEAHQTLPGDTAAGRSQGQILVNTYGNGMLTLDHHSRISTESTGNVAAGSIVLRSERIFINNDSRVSTSSIHADGGAVTLQGGTFFLHDGLITTSVEGVAGDGGDIAIGGRHALDSAGFLIMKHGFVQANTAAPGAAGGNIDLRVDRIIDDRSGGVVVVDAPERMSYHADNLLSVIQAAAPGGTKGAVNINHASLLDISGFIIPMAFRPSEPLELSTDPCGLDSTKERPSSLVLESFCRLPNELGVLSITPLGETRLGRMMGSTP